MPEPQFSVIVPTHNPNRWLSELVRGCLADAQVCQVVLSDDGSRQQEWLDYCDGMSARVKVVRSHVNQGAAAARARGAAVAAGQYLSFIDQDDLVTVDHFRVASKLHKRTELVISSGWRLCGHWLYPLYAQKQRDLTFDRLSKICWIRSPGQVSIARDTYFRAGGFDPACPAGVDDYELWLKLFRYSVPRLWSGVPSFVWREHGDNSSSGLPMGRLADQLRHTYLNHDEVRRPPTMPGRAAVGAALRRAKRVRSERLQFTSEGWQLVGHGRTPSAA